MSFKDCIQGGVKNNVISQEQANELGDLWDRLYSHYNRQMGPGPAMTKASVEATEAMRIALNERKRVRLKQVQAQIRIKQRLTDANIWSESVGFFDFDVRSKHQNVEQLKNSIRGMAHSRMDEVLATFRRNFLGQTRNKATQKDMLNEAFGKDSKNANAKQLAKAWAEATEYLRLRANAAGAQIPFLERWGLPTRHNAIAVRTVDYKEWRDYILPLLDVEKMVDRKTQLPFTKLETTDAEGRINIDVSLNLEAALREVYESIVSEGTNKSTAGKYRGSGAIGKKYQHHRFLVFADGDSWTKYNAKYGGGEPYDIMMGHIDAMSRDIALMETFGPNPNAGVRYLEDLIDEFAIERKKGKTPAKQRFIETQQTYTKYRVNMLYDWVSDKAQAPANEIVAYTFEGIRNTIHSAFLGSTSLLAVPTDINFQRFARAYAGLPQTKVLQDYIKLINPLKAEERTRIAIRMGLIADSWTTMAAGQARYIGEVNGPEVTRRVADIVMRASGLSPWTQAGRLAFGMEFLGFLADETGKSFKQLDPKMQRMMQGYGIEEAKWDIIRSSPMMEEEGVGFLSPKEIESRTDIDATLARQVATDLLRMVQSETDFAVPTSSTKAKSILVGNTKPGTMIGELARSFAMYKNFGMTLLNTHLMRGAMQQGINNKAAYLGGFVISSTLAAALAMQMKEMAKGRDPLNMNPMEEGGGSFWWSALMTSGGLSIYADFVFSQDPTGRSSLPQTMVGPVFGSFLPDVIDLTVGNIYQALNGKDTRFGSELAKFVQRYTPGMSMWYWRTAVERNLFDNLRMWADPKTASDFKRLKTKRARDFNQSYWWDLGDRAPSRAPDFSKVFGN